MKKIYLLAFASLFCVQTLSAQLTLLQQFHEPVAGDVEASVEYDSTSTIPKGTGQNQIWDFSSAVMSTVVAISTTYIPVSSAAQASLFPAATLADQQGGGGTGNSYFKSTATQFEYLGYADASSSMTYTNGMIYSVWPFAYGQTFSDTYSGPLNAPGVVVSISGNFSMTASGAGSLILPGGAMFTNVLQLKGIMQQTFAMTSPTTSSTSFSTIVYGYFHTSQKFPLISVTYEQSTPPSVIIRVNKNLAVGLNDQNFEATFQIFPNPTKEYFEIKFLNANNESCFITIYDLTGQVVKNENLGSYRNIRQKIRLDEFATGIYVVRTTLGGKVSTRKLVVE